MVLARRRFGLSLAGVAQDEHAPLVVADVNVAARVDQDLLGPVDRRAVRAAVLGQTFALRRHEKADFGGDARIGDVENPQTGVEVRGIDQVAGFLDLRQVELLVDVMHAEAAAFGAEILVLGVFRRARLGKE